MSVLEKTEYEMQLENNVKTLKKKVNMQLDRILEVEKLLKEKEDELIQTRKDITELKENLKGENTEHRGASVVWGNDSLILNFTGSFCNIISKLIKNNEFIPYKNYTKNSARYSKVEKAIFDQYMEEEPGIDKKTFINWCVELGYFKSDESKKYVFNDNQVRIYFINKFFITILKGDESC